MAICYELSGNIDNYIRIDNELIFPNMLTCLAVVVVGGGGLVGAHITTIDNGRLPAVAARLLHHAGGPGDVYVAGPGLAYNLTPLANIGTVRICQTPGVIELRVRAPGGVVEFEIAPSGTNGYMRIDGGSFH